MVKEISTVTAEHHQRLQGAFSTEATAGLTLLIRIKTVAILVLALWILSLPVSWLSRVYYEGIVVVFLVLQGVHYTVVRRRRSVFWVPYLVALLEIALLGYAMFVPTPFTPETIPPQVLLRLSGVGLLLIFVALTVLSYAPFLVLWTGLCAALVWSAGFLRVLALPESRTLFDAQVPPYHDPAYVAFLLHPHYVAVDAWLRDVVFILLVSGILAVAVWRAQRLVRNHAATERQRANLARYFAPTVLDEVTAVDGPLSEVRKHDVAVLFADIVGFTTLCETMPPEQVMPLLREYHSRMEEEVFRVGGTLDKFIGDAVMASFGAPRSTPYDATNALRCAQAMLRSMQAWNLRRAEAGEDPIRIGIGVHYGTAVMGDVGSERCAAFAVIGDTTNTTSRLQSLTRSLETDMVVSQVMMDAVRREASDAERELAGLVEAGPQEIRGRARAIRVWTRTENARRLPALEPAEGPAMLGENGEGEKPSDV